MYVCSAGISSESRRSESTRMASTGAGGTSTHTSARWMGGGMVPCAVAVSARHWACSCQDAWAGTGAAVRGTYRPGCCAASRYTTVRSFTCSSSAAPRAAPAGRGSVARSDWVCRSVMVGSEAPVSRNASTTSGWRSADSAKSHRPSRKTPPPSRSRPTIHRPSLQAVGSALPISMRRCVREAIQRQGGATAPSSVPEREAPEARADDPQSPPYPWGDRFGRRHCPGWSG